MPAVHQIHVCRRRVGGFHVRKLTVLIKLLWWTVAVLPAMVIQRVCEDLCAFSKQQEVEPTNGDGFRDRFGDREMTCDWRPLFSATIAPGQML